MSAEQSPGDKSLRQLEQGLRAGFVNKDYPASPLYLPQFLVNDSQKDKKVLSSILRGLQSCDEFWISVAFVTTSGVATLIQTLLALRDQGKRGKILVSQYLYFTQPEALKRLMQFQNLEIRMAVEGNFHSKGYLFHRSHIRTTSKDEADVYDLIIGSSNLTANALCTNIEWNLQVSATPQSHLIQTALTEFQVEFQRAKPVDLPYLELYTALYEQQKTYTARIRSEAAHTLSLGPAIKIPDPNTMQVEAMTRLQELRSQGVRKALLISATGTGKTYLSAFDTQAAGAKRLLFVVHRSRIAAAALESYRLLWGNQRTYGLFTDGHREIGADFVFSTVQTLSRPENLALLDPRAFDYLVLDETHRAGALTYQSILNYFQPQFLLGMTATPERTDGFDIFSLFDHQIAYEIRLHRALEENILSPFHYYGVADLTVDGTVLEEHADFNLLCADQRVNHIIQQSNTYGCDDGVVRGLIFCSSIKEGRTLSQMLNQKGLKTVFLSGESSDEERSEAIRRLESDPKELDYILTVDIFNEGIDIPRVNQVILLRPTQSAIVFVQQLGRGLRKIPQKEYLTVIDFIGNYQRNFLIPIALYGDSTYNKDTLRKLLSSGSNTIPGTSTINFDVITKERIFKAIDQANMSLLADLKKDYQLLRYQLGRIPMMQDFGEHGYRDPMLYVKKYKSYANFLPLVENSWVREDFGPHEKRLLELFSSEINNAKRITESLALSLLLQQGSLDRKSLNRLLKQDYGLSLLHGDWEALPNQLNFGFLGRENTFRNVQKEGESLRLGPDLAKALRSPTFVEFLNDSVGYAQRTYRKALAQGDWVGGFIRYQKYGRKDVCRLLNWPKDISSTVYGYRTNNRVTPLFVTYHKNEEIGATTRYADQLINANTFRWQSRSNRKLDSDEIQQVIHSQRILLFIKKEDSEGRDFYYMGDLEVVEGSVHQSTMPDTTIPVVNFEFSLDAPVDPSMLEYLDYQRT